MISDDVRINRMYIRPGGTKRWPTEHNKLRYWEVIEGKLQVESGGQSLAVGEGGVFVIRPGMSCTAENRQYREAVLSCHTLENYSLMP
jgi:mannose-6-phosphate isomerase-like protein (cupin superfamily)